MEEERVNKKRESERERERNGREEDREGGERSEPPKSEKWLLHMEFSQSASQLPQRLRARILGEV